MLPGDHGGEPIRLELGELDARGVESLAGSVHITGEPGRVGDGQSGPGEMSRLVDARHDAVRLVEYVAAAGSPRRASTVPTLTSDETRLIGDALVSRTRFA